jgi:hypothetical protein
VTQARNAPNTNAMVDEPMAKIAVLIVALGRYRLAKARV